MTQPLVSIITPVLNRAGTIEACLRSVANQSYPAIEHIVVDGGSTDGTLDVLGSFDGREGFRFVSGADEGMYDAINKGFAMATGDVLAYLNSDDVYLPYSVSSAVKELESADIVYGDLGVLVDDDPPSFYVQYYRRFDMRFYTYWWTLAQPTVFWRREVWNRLGPFDTTYRLLGDCEYWLRAASSGIEPHFVPEVLAVQVEHEGTLRVTQEQRMRDEFARLRAFYAEAAGPPGSELVQHVGRSLHWRWKQASFLRAIKHERPRRWPGFIGFLKDAATPIDRKGALKNLLPERFRPRDASIIDASALRKELLAR